MSLASFLEFGGEAVIRGLLSRLEPGVVLQRGKLTELAFGYVKESLLRKGRDLSGISDSVLRRVIKDTARSMQQAGRYTGVPGPLPRPDEIPQWHEPNGPDRFSYTVRIRIRLPDGTTADVITVIDDPNVLSQGQVFSAAIDNIGKRFNIVSDPRRAAAQGAEVESYAVLNIYKGMPT